MNASKANGTPVSLLKLDEGPMTVVPRSIRLREDLTPLTVKRAADARPRGGDWPYRVVPVGGPDARLDAYRVTDVRDGSHRASFDHGQMAKAIRLMDDLNDQYRREKEAPVPAEAHASLDAMVDHSETPGLDARGTFEDTDAELVALARAPERHSHLDADAALDRLRATWDDGGCRARRADRLRGLERLQDELELVAEIREQTLAEYEAERQAEALDWRRKALRRLLGACGVTFAAGLAIGAGIAQIL